MKDSVYKISLDINEHGSQVVLKAKQSDTGRKIHISLRAGGTPYTIDEDCYAVFTATKPDGSILYNACTIEGNEIIYEFTAQTCAAVGRSRCEIKLYGKDDTLITSPRFALLIDGIVYPDGRVESTDEFSALVQMVSDTLTVQASASEATESAKEATGNAIEATEKATVATAAANQATTAATKAAQSASTATESANGAAGRASEAAEAANNATNDANMAAEKANEATTNVVRIVKNAMAVGEASGVIASLEDAVELGFVGCRIFGKTTQDGTPTPEAPVELVSAGADGDIIVTVGGANLMPSTDATFEKNGITIVFNGNSATVKGTNTADTPVNTNGPVSIPLPIAKGNYSVTTSANNVFPQVSIINADGSVGYYSRSYSLTGTERRVNLYLEVKGGATVNTAIDLMVNAGSTLLPFEPYNGQTIAISTPNGLPGIPVTSGGNYTDANGQQWICDEVNLERGVYVKRIDHTNLAGVAWVKNDSGKYFTTKNHGLYSNAHRVVCTHVKGGFPSDSNKENVIFINANNDIRLNITLDEDSVEAVQETMNGATLIGVLVSPIETPLSEEELAAYAALHTYRDNTTVTNDAGAYMELEYVMDAKKYIDSLVGSGGSARLTNVTLKSSAWKTESDGLHSQVVSIAGVTEYSKVDLLPSVEQLAIFHNKDVTFVTENEDGVVTVYAIGDKPILDYTMQAQITEVVV